MGGSVGKHVKPEISMLTLTFSLVLSWWEMKIGNDQHNLSMYCQKKKKEKKKKISESCSCPESTVGSRDIQTHQLVSHIDGEKRIAVGCLLTFVVGPQISATNEEGTLVVGTSYTPEVRYDTMLHLHPGNF